MSHDTHPTRVRRPKPPTLQIKVLFSVILVVVVLLTFFSIRYNVAHVQGEPFSDLIDLMAKPLANTNFSN